MPTIVNVQRGRRWWLGLGVSALVLRSLPAEAAELVYELVERRTCLAGEWGKPRRQWRIQLGIFHTDAAADDFLQALDQRGVRAHGYIAAWLAKGDVEPIAVVSAGTFSDGAAARASAKKLRAQGVAAFARHFTCYER